MISNRAQLLTTTRVRMAPTSPNYVFENSYILGERRRESTETYRIMNYFPDRPQDTCEIIALTGRDCSQYAHPS